MYSAIELGLDPLEVILFIKYSPNFDSNFFTHLLSSWPNIETMSVIYPLGNLYGVIGIVLAIVLFSLGPNRLPNLVVTANGLYWGYFLTIYVSGNIFEIIEIDLIDQMVLKIKLAYIFLIYYIFESSKCIIKHPGLSKKKYETALDGLYIFIVTLILIKGFENDAMSILTGPIFLVCTFLTTLIAEQTIGRLVFGLQETCKIFDKVYSSKQIFTHLWQNIKIYKGQELDFPYHIIKFWSIIRTQPVSFLKLSLLVFIVNSIFPIIIFIFTIYLFGKLVSLQ